MQKNILIIGYGDVAKRLIKVLDTKSKNIYAISRNDSSNPNINKFNWDWLSDKKVDLKAKNFDSVIIIPKPSSLDEKGYKDGFIIATQNILNLLSNLNINKVIAISSTRVYGGHHKGPVDEKSIEKPSEFRGKFIQEYEVALSQIFGPKLTILRFSGLYDNQSKKTSHNKLHRDQAAKIIAHFIEYKSESVQAIIINCSEDSEILFSEKSIINTKLKQTGFKF
jgi:nucleoside-diphosphate-sugar epimerase